MTPHYTKKFYDDQKEGSSLAARQVVPLLIELVKPASVLDVGCGVATWLKIFLDQGVPDIQGVDGDYVDRSMLQIPPEQFKAWDLSKPLKLERRFDVALSLEVAEHLSPDHADTIVATLVRHAPVVMFSAAVPFQGGMNHVNEQWPEYWAGRFAQHGYLPVDAIRGRIWQNPNIAPYYRQNILLYANKDALASNSRLREYHAATNSDQLAIVHPDFYLRRVDVRRMTLGKLVRAFPDALKRAVKDRKIG